jgi:hypothetical protein
MNWNELKEFCNSLPESELSKNVILWREDAAITNINAIVLTEDHYIDNEGDMEGCAPLSDIEYSYLSDEENYPNGLEDFKKVYDKGTPILWEEI